MLEMALATQFAFDADPIIKPGPTTCAAAGVTLPIHIGIAGPAKLQTLIKFAIACGVGPSLKVLQKARDGRVSKLLLPYEPTDVLTKLAAHKAANPDFNITRRFTSSRWAASRPMPQWAIENGGASDRARKRHLTEGYMDT